MISRRFFLGGASAVAAITIAKANIPLFPLEDGALVESTPAWVPPGFMLPQGQELSRLMYRDLFAAVGDAYGGGPTTFKLPNYGAQPPVPGSCALIIASERTEYAPAGFLLDYFVPCQAVSA